jgi:hypothetical protein
MVLEGHFEFEDLSSLLQIIKEQYNILYKSSTLDSLLKGPRSKHALSILEEI